MDRVHSPPEQRYLTGSNPRMGFRVLPPRTLPTNAGRTSGATTRIWPAGTAMLRFGWPDATRRRCQSAILVGGTLRQHGCNGTLGQHGWNDPLRPRLPGS